MGKSLEDAGKDDPGGLMRGGRRAVKHNAVRTRVACGRRDGARARERAVATQGRDLISVRSIRRDDTGLRPLASWFGYLGGRCVIKASGASCQGLEVVW